MYLPSIRTFEVMKTNGFHLVREFVDNVGSTSTSTSTRGLTKGCAAFCIRDY